MHPLQSKLSTDSFNIPLLYTTHFLRFCYNCCTCCHIQHIMNDLYTSPKSKSTLHMFSTSVTKHQKLYTNICNCSNHTYLRYLFKGKATRELLHADTWLKPAASSKNKSSLHEVQTLKVISYPFLVQVGGKRLRK